MFEINARYAQKGTAPGENSLPTSHWFDLSGNRRHGRLYSFGYSSSSGWAQQVLTSGNNNGKVIDYLQADASDDYVNIASPVNLASTLQYTEEMWIFGQDADNRPATSAYWFWTQDRGVTQGTTYPIAGWLMYSSSSDQMRYWIRSGDNVSANAYTQVNMDDGALHHLVAVVDGAGAGTVQVYVDGVARGSASVASLDTTKMVMSYRNVCAAGSSSYPSPARLIANRVYSFPLTAAQVMQNYVAGPHAISAQAQAGSYALPVMTDAFDPADGEVRYFGYSLFSTTTLGYQVPVRVPRNGIIRSIDIQWRGTGTSAESITIAVKDPSSASYIDIATVSNTATVKEFLGSAMTLRVYEGDLLYFRLTCPTWTTNPTGVVLGGNVYIEGD